MLQHAAELYQGEIDILGYAITQGSYTFMPLPLEIGIYLRLQFSN
jgi:hypothetical protein